jgi:hypothetical protein
MDQLSSVVAQNPQFQPASGATEENVALLNVLWRLSAEACGGGMGGSGIVQPRFDFYISGHCGIILNP